MHIRNTALAIALASLAACNPKPKEQITGKVLDNFGHALPGATVSIQNSAFKAETDKDGTFSIEYVPGTITIQIGKDGYTQQTSMLNIAVPSTYPLGEVTLFKLPFGNGILLQGEDDYVTLLPERISANPVSDGNMNQVFTYSLQTLNDAAKKYDELNRELTVSRGHPLVFVDASGGRFTPYLAQSPTQLGVQVSGFTQNRTNLRVLKLKEERQAGFTIYRTVHTADFVQGMPAPLCFVSTHRNMGGYLMPDTDYLASCIGGPRP